MKKKILISVLSLCLCAFLGLSTNAVVKANTIPTETGLTLQSSASIRTEEPYGIKFTADISKSEVNTLNGLVSAGKSVEYGMLIIPSDILASGSYTLDFNENDGLVENTTSEVDSADNKVFNKIIGELKETTDCYTYECSLVGIKENNLSRPFTAKGYIKITDGDNVSYLYSTNEVSRAIYTVATYAVADTETNYGTEINNFCNGIITSVNTNYSAPEYKMYLEDGTEVVYAEKNQEVKFVGTVAKNGDATRTLEVCPSEVTSSNLQAVEGKPFFYKVLDNNANTFTASLKVGTALSKEFNIFRQTGITATYTADRFHTGQSTDFVTDALEVTATYTDESRNSEVTDYTFNKETLAKGKNSITVSANGYTSEAFNVYASDANVVLDFSDWTSMGNNQVTAGGYTLTTNGLLGFISEGYVRTIPAKNSFTYVVLPTEIITSLPNYQNLTFCVDYWFDNEDSYDDFYQVLSIESGDAILGDQLEFKAKEAGKVYTAEIPGWIFSTSATTFKIVTKTPSVAVNESFVYYTNIYLKPDVPVDLSMNKEKVLVDFATGIINGSNYNMTATDGTSVPSRTERPGAYYTQKVTKYYKNEDSITFSTVNDYGLVLRRVPSSGTCFYVPMSLFTNYPNYQNTKFYLDFYAYGLATTPGKAGKTFIYNEKGYNTSVWNERMIGATAKETVKDAETSSYDGYYSLEIDGSKLDTSKTELMFHTNQFADATTNYNLIRIKTYEEQDYVMGNFKNSTLDTTNTTSSKVYYNISLNGTSYSINVNRNSSYTSVKNSALNVTAYVGSDTILRIPSTMFTDVDDYTNKNFYIDFTLNSTFVPENTTLIAVGGDTTQTIKAKSNGTDTSGKYTIKIAGSSIKADGNGIISLVCYGYKGDSNPESRHTSIAFTNVYEEPVNSYNVVENYIVKNYVANGAVISSVKVLEGQTDVTSTVYNAETKKVSVTADKNYEVQVTLTYGGKQFTVYSYNLNAK